VLARCRKQRIYAALKAGHTTADLVVKSYADDEMIRIYATENVTQRGTDMGLAMSGSVAAAIRYIIKGVLINDADVRKYFLTLKAFETTRGQIASDKGFARFDRCVRY
jgi:hypothetical protein